MAPSVKMLCRCLCRLRNLCQSAAQEYRLEIKSPAHYRNWVESDLDESLRLLDVIGATRDVMAQMKDHLGDIRSTLRRRSSDMENRIGAYQSFRKKMKKQIVKHIKDLKRKPAKWPHTSVITNALREATFLTVSFLESLVSFMFVSGPLMTKKKYSLVSKWVGTGRVACEGGDQRSTVNEVARVEICFSSIRDQYKSPKHKDGVEEANYAQKQLEELEGSIISIQDGLDNLFKCSIETRVSLLNALSY